MLWEPEETDEVVTRRRRAGIVNAYLTTCKICREGVYQRQPKLWLNKPMGWSHEFCVTRILRGKGAGDEHATIVQVADNSMPIMQG